MSLLSNEYDDHGHRFTGALDRWAYVLGSAKGVAGMFVPAGDANPRHNVPGQPVFDPIAGALFLLGLARTAYAAWRPCVGDRGAPSLPAWHLLWWAIMAFSSAFATEAPHYHRTAGSMAPTYAFAALGLDWLWRRRAVAPLPPSRARALLAALVVVVSARQRLRTERALFGPFATSELVAAAWQSGLTRFGEDVAGTPGRRPAAAYLQAGADSRELRVTTAFFAGDGPPVHWLPPDQLVLPIPESVGGDVLYGGDVRQSLDAIVPVVLPEASLDVRVHGPPGAPDYALYRLPSVAFASERAAELPVRATFGRQVRLYGAAVRPAAGSAGQPSWIVRLRWSYLPESRGQYDLFVQALDASGKLAAQDDHGIPAEALPPGSRASRRIASPCRLGPATGSPSSPAWRRPTGRGGCHRKAGGSASTTAWSS